MPEVQGKLVLAQNQYALVQDATKGNVQVYAGPYGLDLSGNDKPVRYDRAKDTFVPVLLDQAITQNPLVGEGSYLVLVNPAFDQDSQLVQPRSGTVSAASNVKLGRKINIPGPATFPLWPGQWAEAIAGHHLRSNQYLVVRVYNAEEAERNATALLKSATTDGADEPESSFVLGQMLVIKGTEASFFIPPTGFEVLSESDGGYVREALTLERLEYAILLDEDGNKRYERGPQVVFPTSTEKFITRNEQADDGKAGRGNSRKFKAIELNDQMGLYIKVTADYEEEVPEGELAAQGLHDAVGVVFKRADGVTFTFHDGKVFRQFKTGEELFVTGKEQRIYYQRAEHALIGYDDPAGGFRRERYYGITIPKGEGRYVLDTTIGDIKMEVGPQILLPDPRTEKIVRRVLDPKTVNLWYPGNAEALAFNATLAAQATEDMGYAAFNTAASDISRSMNRLTASNISGGDKFQRGNKFTPPPMLTLNTKYEGVPAIGVWTGYAVQIVDRSGKRRVVVGPGAALLQYDESLEMLELSTGKPKNADTLLRVVYLRVDHNLISDIVTVETKDLVEAKLKVSYRVNFLREHQDKWFAVENHVKYLCDHMRSHLRAAMKKETITDLMQNSAALIRDVVLGPKTEPAATLEAASDGRVTASDVVLESKRQRTKLFPENGMEVYDVEVLGVDIADAMVATMLKTAQTSAVANVITLSAEEQALTAARRKTAIALENADLNMSVQVHNQENQQTVAKVQAATIMEALEAELATKARKGEAAVEAEEWLTEIAAAETARRRTVVELNGVEEAARTEAFKARMAAITPDLISAINQLGETAFMAQLSESLAPLALAEQSGLGQTIERVFKGTPLEPVIQNMQTRFIATK